MTLLGRKTNLPVVKAGRFVIGNKTCHILLFGFLVCLVLMPAAISADLESLLGDSVLAGAHVGVIFKDIKADTILFAINQDKRFIPASNMKLFTSAAALELLGPQFRFKTTFVGNGVTEAFRDTLYGDLVIGAGGDPLISGRFRGDMLEIFRCWADSLKAHRVRTITGGLVIINSFFADDPLGSGWSHDDLSYWYACPTSPFSFNDNCVDLKIYPGRKINDTCRVFQEPAIGYIKLSNRTKTLPAGSPRTIDFLRYPGSDSGVIFGGLAIDDTNGLIEYISVSKPAEYAAKVLRHVLESEGIVILGGEAVVDSNYQFGRIRTLLFNWVSDSLPVVLSVINKNSQNFFAEQTLKTIGVVYGTDGSFASSSKIVSDWLQKLGITADDINMIDGSGLSMLNLVKPSAIVTLLDEMTESSSFEIYYNSLAVPGIDRSVRGRMAGQPLADKMRVKTGRVANVSTFSGYLTTKTGRLLAFSIMINNTTTPEILLTRWQDKLCSYFIDNY